MKRVLRTNVMKNPVMKFINDMWWKIPAKYDDFNIGSSIVELNHEGRL